MANSDNHQFIEFADKVVARYVKTDLNSLTGFRLDPYDENKQLTFFLSTPESNFDFQNKSVVGFTYDAEVLELYSEREHTYFKRANKKLLEAGLLKPYADQREEIDSPNFLDDTEVNTIASLTNLKAAEKRINELTSKQTLNRVLSTMNDLGRKESFKKLVQNRLYELDANS